MKRFTVRTQITVDAKDEADAEDYIHYHLYKVMHEADFVQDFSITVDTPAKLSRAYPVSRRDQ